MKKGQILELVGLVLLAGLFYFGIQGAGAQTATSAPDSHTSCLPTKDYANSNGYVESYTRSNTCHSKKVFFYSGPHYRNSNNWRVRCPSGSTTYVHNRAHYMMSPTLDGEYDGGAGGGAHYYCVDASGSQVDPIPGESDTNPFHTHIFDGLAKVDIVDSDTDYYYSYKTGQWVSCSGGYQGPFQNSSSYIDTQYGNFNNHFHCKNANYAAGSTSDNPEAAPVALTTPPSTSLVGSFSTSDTGTKDQFIDKGPWGATAPLGTVACVHTNSDKVYFSTTGTCPAANLFPLKATYSFALTKVDATIEAKTGTTAWIKFNLKNNSTTQIDFPVYCDSGNGSFMGNMYNLNADGTIGEKFVNPGAYSNATSVPSANAIIAAGAEKSFQFKFDIPASNSVTGTWNGKCHTYPKDNSTGNSLTDKKQEITNTLTVTATADAPTAVSATALTQYGTNKYSIKVEDADGVKEFSVKTLGSTAYPTGRSMYGGSPGAAGNIGSCSGTNPFKILESGTVTIESSEWPLNFTVTDCKANVKIGNVSPPGGLPPPPPPPPPTGGPPEPLNNDPGVWAQVEVSTSQIVTTAICTKSVCGINGEYHGYVPPPTFATGSIWWPTSKRYIWQLQGQAGYSSGTFNFNTNVFTVPGGTIYNGQFTSTTPPPPGTTTPPTDDHTGCDMTIYYMKDGKYVDDKGAAGPTTESLTGTSRFYKWLTGGDHYHICSSASTGTTTPPQPPTPNNWRQYTWTFSDGSATSYVLNRTDAEYTAFIASVDSACRRIPQNKFFWKSGSGDDSATNWRNFGIPDCSGTGTPPPVPPDYEEKHRGCDMTVYRKNSTGLMVDENGKPAPIPASKPGYITDFKWVDDHYHLCSTPIEPPVCGQAITRAYNPKTGECRDFSTTCIGDWVRKDCKLTGPVEPPIEPECRSDQPQLYGLCEMPEYRWHIVEKKWEKCDRRSRNQSMPYRGDVMNNPKATHTSCQSMYFDIEEKWRTMRYEVRPPEKYGEWYMPAWDAAADVKQYNPKTDRFEDCRREPYPNPGLLPMIAPGWELEWRGLCSPVPKEDAEWLLEMNRAQYKLWQLRKKVSQPDEPPIPPEPPQPPPEDLPPALCKGYLRGLRNSLNGDKQFFKDVKRQSAELPADHPDVLKISSLLDEGKKIIVDMEKFIRIGTCQKEALLQIQSAKDKLHTEIFAELSSYLSGIHDYVEVGFCRTNLEEKVKRLGALAKKADDESRADLEEFAAEIKAKLAEFKEKAGDFEYDAAFECREYVREVESEFSTLVRENDRDVRRVVEDILEKELGPVLEQLRQESEARKERIDQLLVQVAELRKAADQVSGAVTDIKKSAEELSQKVAVSLKALAYIEEKFEEQKLQIEDAKGKLVPLVQRAIEILGKNRCLRGAPQASMMAEFNTMTSVNWIGNRDEELEKRLNSFITACEAREVAAGDVETFVRAVDEASEQNQLASHEKGLTPFADVPTHEWYYGGMVTGHRTGFITQGRPGDNVLRQDALLMILRVKGLGDAELKGECEIPRTSSVINASPYARCAVARALEKGLIVRGDVSVPVSRGEIASWIAALELIPDMSDERVKEIQSSYQDLGRGVLPEWVSAITRLVEAKVMVGQVGSEVSIWQPFDNLTRAALAVVLEQLQKLQ